jgi:chemotaxis protein methyltransferase CheR
LATDVSEKALARARSGIFGPRSTRALPAGIEGRYLHRETNERVRVEPSLLAVVEWKRLNLMASESLLRYGTQLSCEEHGGAFFYRRTT